MDPLFRNDRPGEFPPSWYPATAHPPPARPPLQGTRKADDTYHRAGITGPGACATDDVRVPRALDATWTPAGYP